MKYIIAFAEHGGYFLSGPGYRCTHNLPDWFREIVSTALEIYCVAFGPGDAAVVTYLDAQSGCLKLRIKNTASMPGLTEYLLDRNYQGGYMRYLRHLEVSFGERDGSYWASDGQSSIYHTLPEKLEQDLCMLRTERGAWRDGPPFVALGAGENYVLVTGYGALSSRLGIYPQVFYTLNAAASAPGGVGSIQGIYLNYFDGSSVVQWADGSLHGFNLGPEATRDIAQINRQANSAQVACRMAQEQLRQAQIMQQTMFAHEEAAIREIGRKQLENLQWAGEMSALASDIGCSSLVNSQR